MNSIYYRTVKACLERIAKNYYKHQEYQHVSNEIEWGIEEHLLEVLQADWFRES